MCGIKRMQEFPRRNSFKIPFSNFFALVPLDDGRREPVTGIAFLQNLLNQLMIRADQIMGTDVFSANSRDGEASYMLKAGILHADL